MRLLLRQGVRHHSRHPLQTLLTLFGIAIGTALACAMQLAQGTAEQSFDRALETVAGTATHAVTAGSEGIPVERVARLRARLAGRGVAPSVSAIVRVPDARQRTVLRALGVDPFSDGSVRDWSATGGTAKASLPVAALVTTPGGFVATASLLARLDVAVGSTLPITVAGRPFTAKCLGVLQTDGRVAAGLEDVLLVDIATAQEWTGRLDRVDRVDLRVDAESLPSGITEANLADVVREELGAVDVEAAGAKRSGLAHLARGFRINLRALSLLALLVGAFLVHETMRLSVVARRQSFGVLRALGARGSSLGVVVASEAALLGLLGSALGVGLGVGFAFVLIDPIVRTLNDHYATFELPRVAIDPFVLGWSLLLGTAVATLAALAPAIAAARIPPREVLVAHRLEGRTRVRRFAVWALVPAALAVVLLQTTGDRLVQGYLGTLAMLVAAVALVPPALGAMLALFARLVRRRGPFVRYVVRSTAAARDHFAMPLAAMALALAATIGLATLITSFRTNVETWLEQVLPADVYVMVPGGVDERPRSTIADEIVVALRTAPGIAASSTYQRTLQRLRTANGEGDVEVVGIDPTPRVLRAFPFVAGDDDAGRTAMQRGDGAWVSEPLAFRWKLAIGDVVTVQTAAGPVTIPISGIHRDYSNERGEMIVGKTWFDAHLRGGFTALSMHAEPGTDVERLVEQLRERAAATADQALSIRSQRDLRVGSMEIFDRSFAITGVMRLLCLAVAFFGIWSAFAALQLERGREVGLLRCLGARPAHIRGVVLGQTALLGLCAGLFGVPIGVALGHVLANIINRVSFGWSVPAVTTPASVIVETVVFSVIAALLAGIHPAVRFARMRPADALREA